MNAPPIRVAVVDEHEIFRRGLITCLTEDPQVELLAALPTGPVPAESQVAVVSPAAARECTYDCPLVVCGSEDVFTDGNVVLGRISRGSLTPTQLLAAVHAASAGLRVDCQGRSREGTSTLDERGLIVLRMLAEGAGTEEIAASMRYSERTVKGVIQQVEQRLGARSRAQAVALGIKRGLI